MRCGLFGKIPAKRDFLALDVPRGFLTLWEAFLEHSLAGSRTYLTAPIWQEAYHGAAIWRFWLGPELCGGMPFMGALMPSVDAVGRQFPLSLIAFDPDTPVKPPGAAAFESWFDAVEQFLLSALDAELEFSLAACLNKLAMAARTGSGAERGVPRCYRCPFTAGAQVCELSSLFPDKSENCLAETSFWWTAGGAGFEPLAFELKGLPDFKLFANMLTGRFQAVSRPEFGPGAGAR